MAAKYICPTCGQEIERDLLLFLDHTQGHIISYIKEKHPEWIEKDGICPKCHEYYKKMKEK